MAQTKFHIAKSSLGWAVSITVNDYYAYMIGCD